MFLVGFFMWILFSVQIYKISPLPTNHFPLKTNQNTS